MLSPGLSSSCFLNPFVYSHFVSKNRNKFVSLLLHFFSTAIIFASTRLFIEKHFINKCTESNLCLVLSL